MITRLENELNIIIKRKQPNCMRAFKLRVAITAMFTAFTATTRKCALRCSNKKKKSASHLQKKNRPYTRGVQ